MSKDDLFGLWFRNIVSGKTKIFFRVNVTLSLKTLESSRFCFVFITMRAHIKRFNLFPNDGLDPYLFC